jgi:alkaline phosphatase D
MDVHFTAAHYYDPDKAVFQNFAPFWEFVSGPLNAVVAKDTNMNSPMYGNQFFGEVDIDGSTAVMTVRLRDTDGAVRYQVDIDPRDY